MVVLQNQYYDTLVKIVQMISLRRHLFISKYIEGIHKCQMHVIVC